MQEKENENQEKIIQRLNRVIGQLEGIKKMIKKNDNKCTDILIQFKASKSAIESAMKLFSLNEINSCFNNLDKNENKKELDKILDSIIK